MRGLSRFMGRIALTVSPLAPLWAEYTEAAPYPDEVVMLESLEVVGSRLLGPDQPAAPAVTVLDESFIERSGASDLASLLALLPDAYGGSASGYGTVPNGTPSYGNATALFNFSTGAAAPLRQTGVSSVGLGGLGAGGTLVLVNGRRIPLSTQEDTASSTGAGFYDLSSIPLGMVERIEVLSNGASAIYGSDAVGGVVNVVLRRDYVGNELRAGVRFTEEGGAAERHATLLSGFVRGPLSVHASVGVRSRDSLQAGQRAFSSSPNLIALGGRDHQLLVGSPGVISAVSGTLNGVTDADGNPVRHALVPVGQNGEGLTPDDFTGAAGFFSSGLRKYDAQAERDLLGAFDQTSVNLSGNYTVNERLDAFAEIFRSDFESITDHEPPAVFGGGFGGLPAIVPASDPRNPFGQNVYFSGVLVEAPPRTQTVELRAMRLHTGLSGRLGDTWRWDASITVGEERFDSRTLELDPAAFVAALADGSFNPFGDPLTDGPINAHLNPRLTRVTRIDGYSRLFGADIGTRGSVFELPAGDAKLALGAETWRAERYRHSTNPLFGQPAEISSARVSNAVFSELYTPLSGEDFSAPFLRRLEARFAGRLEEVAPFSRATPSVGLFWQPVRGLSFTADYAEGFRAPALTELEDLVTSGTTTISDPKQGGASYSVNRLSGGNPDLGPETSRTRQLGAALEPAFASGLRLETRFRETLFEDKINALSAQTLVDHEDSFPERVVRGPDGRVATVNSTAINYGEILVRSVSFVVSYDHEYEGLGRVGLRFDATRQLDYRVEDRPGRPANEIIDGADTASPPEWRVLTTLTWNRGPWDAAVITSYLSGYETNGSGPFFDAATSAPSWTTTDLRIGYTFQRGLWGGYCKDARVQIGVGNIADRQPPFANTVYGYNQSVHSPLGRTYDFSIRLPF